MWDMLIVVTYAILHLTLSGVEGCCLKEKIMRREELNWVSCCFSLKFYSGLLPFNIFQIHALKNLIWDTVSEHQQYCIWQTLMLNLPVRST